MSTHTDRWSVTLHLSEDDGNSIVRAVLTTHDSELTGRGAARCNPSDKDVPQIGDELAASRALSDLAHQLLDAAARDIEAATGDRAVLQG